MPSGDSQTRERLGTESPRQSSPSLPDSWDVGECAFCGSQCGQGMADLAGEIYRAAERLVEVAPRPPWFRCNTSEYVEALRDFARYLGVEVE